MQNTSNIYTRIQPFERENLDESTKQLGFDRPIEQRGWMTTMNDDDHDKDDGGANLYTQKRTNCATVPEVAAAGG